MSNHEFLGAKEIYLAPETEKIKNAEEIAELSLEVEKYPFIIGYDPTEKDTIITELKKLGCVIVGHSDDISSVVALMTMEQLAAIKTLDCVERVEVSAASDSSQNSDNIETLSLNNTAENSIINNEINATATPTALSVGNAVSTASNSISTAIQLGLNSWQSGEICCPGAEMWYKFTPGTTAYYTIYTGGSLDTVGYLYNSGSNQINNNDDAGSGLNFKMVHRLTANQTYYIKVNAYGSGTGYFSIAVTNTVFVESVTINNASVTLNKGDSVTLTATVLPSYATNKSLRWESSDTGVVTVNSSTGKITAVNRGSACICAYSQDGTGKSSCCEVVVNVPVESVTIDTSTRIMHVGTSDRFTATVCPDNANNKLLRWTSSNTAVATVNSATGYVTAKSVGETIIKATAQDGTGKYGVCTLTVEPAIPVKSITICCSTHTMNVGESTYLSYDIYPANATNQSVVWCSSNSHIAEVNASTGRITAQKAGITIITATTDDGAFVASCKVTVNQVLTGADVYIDDNETRNLIIQYKTVYDYIETAYLSGTLNICQKNEQQASIEKAINITRADYVIINPQSNFVYQYFKGRNHNDDDISPFERESYTYPNDGYDDPKDTLAITIIQRTLELLTYFEPPNEYEYGVYDQETHDALLSSPFYILGSNDFQKYSYYDMLGSTTVNERTKSNIKMLHKMRLFHNEVAAWVARKVAPNSRIHNTTIYKNSNRTKWGFADVMKTATANEYIWEVKPWGQRYRVLNSMAAMQLSSYINAWNDNSIDQKYSPRLSALPGYNIGKFAFRSQLTGKIVVVESNPAVAPDTRCGLVHYYPTEDDNEYQTEYATEYAFETEAVPVAVPTYDYSFGASISFGNVSINGMAEFTGQVFVIAAIGATLFYCSPWLLAAFV